MIPVACSIWYLDAATKAKQNKTKQKQSNTKESKTKKDISLNTVAIYARFCLAL